MQVSIFRSHTYTHYHRRALVIAMYMYLPLIPLIILNKEGLNENT